MKIKLLFFALLLFTSVNFHLSTVETTPVISFETKTISLPAAKAGTLLEFSYNFKNTGNGTLVINGSQVACTCTKVEFPKEPIPPNGSGKVKVVFDTKGKFEAQDRMIILTSNAKKKTVKIRFKVWVNE